MLHKPWHFTGIFVAVVFVASMFFGYYSCKNSETCTAPFVGSFDDLSQEEIQSKLLSTRARIRRIKKPVGKITSGSSLKKTSSKSTSSSSNYFYEKIPKNWNPANIIIASGSGGKVKKEDIDLVRRAIYPFKDMISKIKLVIYIHYNKNALGKGIRAYTSSYGKVMNIIAPDSYSFRKISNREYIAILRHEMGHVIHDQVLTYSDRKSWEKLVLKNGKVLNDAGFSSYGRYDEYEALSEAMIGLMFTDAKLTAKQKKLLEKMYDFLEKHFRIIKFEDQRDSYVFNSSKISKDATRIFDDYPLPQFSL